jgi:hypothetical protein
MSGVHVIPFAPTYLPTHPPTYLLLLTYPPIYLPTYYNLSTYLLIITYLFTYLPTHLLKIYYDLPTHQPTYVPHNLVVMC